MEMYVGPIVCALMAFLAYLVGHHDGVKEGRKEREG